MTKEIYVIENDDTKILKKIEKSFSKDNYKIESIEKKDLNNILKNMPKLVIFSEDAIKNIIELIDTNKGMNPLTGLPRKQSNISRIKKKDVK